MKSSKLVFNSLAISLLLTGTYNLEANAQSSSSWVKQALGSYQSKIWSAGSLISGTTEFKEASDGSLEGRYTMNEQDGLVSGKLSQCQATQIRVVLCVWNDKYGTGKLELTFFENFSGFNGYWEEGNAEPAYRWSGSR